MTSQQIFVVLFESLALKLWLVVLFDESEFCCKDKNLFC